jgi:hypothetical protein
MNITSSGNVGIGTDSISNGTTFGGGGQINRLKVQSTNYTCLEINGSTSGGSVQFTYGTNLPNQVAGLIAYNYANGAANEFVMSNVLSGPLIFATSNTERIRITSNGTIAFNGNSTPSSGGLDKLSLGFSDGAYGWIQTWSGRPLTLNSEGNNVLIGTTTDLGYRLQVAGTIFQSEYTYHGNNASGNMNGATWINTGLTLPTSNLATYEVYAIGNENNQNQCVRIYFIYYNTNIGWTATLAETNVQPTGNDYGIVNIRMTSGGTIEVNAANSVSTGLYRIVVMNQFKN